jgi:small redox-active disulfide protein 2
MKIEIYGSGCSRCKETEKKVNEALQYLAIQADVSEVSEPTKIAESGTLQTPAVSINGEIKCSGRIPEVRELHNWITTAAIQEES